MGEEWNSRRIPRVLESLDVLEFYPHVLVTIDNVNLESLSLCTHIILRVLHVFEDRATRAVASYHCFLRAKKDD